MPKISDLLVEIGLKTDKLERGLKKSNQEISSFGKGINRLGSYIAGAFAVSKLTAFGTEVSKLAGEAEGVENAFKRIGTRDDLANLRKATRNTVSDLELMRKTVEAKKCYS